MVAVDHLPGRPVPEGNSLKVLPPLVMRFEKQWQTHLYKNRAFATLNTLIFLSLVLWAFHMTGFTSLEAGQNPLQKIGEFLVRMNPQLSAEHLFEDSSVKGSVAHWYYRWPQWRDAMIETIEMAFVSTVLGSILGVFAALMTARTTMPIASIRWVLKRFLEIVRIVPDLVLAIIFVSLFGLGPFAGVLTMVLSSMSSLGRYFSEAMENVSETQRLAVRAAGGNALQQIRFGIIPQVVLLFLSFSFLRFEVNISAATTLGLVGAGGIGLELIRALNFNQYQSYLAILILIVVVITLTDLVSEKVRHRMNKVEAAL